MVASKFDFLKAHETFKEVGKFLIPLPNYTLEIRNDRERHQWVYGKEGDSKYPLPGCGPVAALGEVCTEAFYQIIIRGDKELVPNDDYEWSRQRPYKPDVVRVEKGDYSRASGEVVCQLCGCTFAEHSTVTGYPWLNRLCNGRLVHL